MSPRAFLLGIPAAAAIAAALTHAPLRADGPAPDAASARIELGRRLFFDPAIGRQGRIGCASCHDPEHGFSDERILSVDESAELPRHSQPLTDLTGEGFHWDGAFDTVRDVVEARVLPTRDALDSEVKRMQRRLAAAPPRGDVRDVTEAARERVNAALEYYGIREQTTSSEDVIAGRLAADDRYRKGFVAAFGDGSVSAARIADALESYLRSLTTGTSPFDRLLAGDPQAFSASALRGLVLFRGKAGCAACHVIEGNRPTFTDGRFHDTGVEMERALRTSSSPDSGRVATHFGEAERRAFKTPSLRDVARRAPYFHDGSAATLADVVRYYDSGGSDDSLKDPRVKRLNLSPGQIDDLVAFLEALTGEQRAGLGRPTAHRSPRLAIHVVRLDGTPSAGTKVRAAPFGDRLAGTTAMPAATEAVTDDSGDATVDMPLSTHVIVEVRGRARSLPLPDWTDRADVCDVPESGVYLRLCATGDGFVVPDRFELLDTSPELGLANAFDEPLIFQKVSELGAGDLMFMLEQQPADAEADGPVLQRVPALTPTTRLAVDRRPGAVNTLRMSFRPVTMSPAPRTARLRWS